MDGNYHLKIVIVFSVHLSSEVFLQAVDDPEGKRSDTVTVEGADIFGETEFDPGQMWQLFFIHSAKVKISAAEIVCPFDGFPEQQFILI